MIERRYWRVWVGGAHGMSSTTFAGSLEKAREDAERTKGILGPDAISKITRVTVKRRHFQEGAAVAFGLMGMAESIRDRKWFSTECGECGEIDPHGMVYDAKKGLVLCGMCDDRPM